MFHYIVDNGQSYEDNEKVYITTHRGLVNFLQHVAAQAFWDNFDWLSPPCVVVAWCEDPFYTNEEEIERAAVKDLFSAFATACILEAEAKDPAAWAVWARFTTELRGEE
jgi:hypothetical protein